MPQRAGPSRPGLAFANWSPSGPPPASRPSSGLFPGRPASNLPSSACRDDRAGCRRPGRCRPTASSGRQACRVPGRPGSQIRFTCTCASGLPQHYLDVQL